MRLPSIPDMTEPAKSRRWLEIILLLLVIVAGMLFRLDDLQAWRQNNNMAFFNGQPIHTTYDAWYYLGLAQDLLNDNYNTVDEKRGVPDSPLRPSPPPLLSVMAATLVKATNSSLSWIGALLPVLLGSLLAVPLYLLGRFFGGPIAGLSAALLAVLSPYYIIRSNIGRFDTDCLNVTLAASGALCFLYFGKETGRKRYLYLAGGLVVYGLFLWWWDQAPAAVTAITLPPLAIALAFFFRPPKKEALLLYGGLAALFLIVIAVFGLDLPLKIIQGLWGKFLYISKDASGNFPNIGITITEQRRPDLATIIWNATGLSVPRRGGNLITALYALPLLAGLIGIALMVWRRPKESLFLLPIFILAAASFFANRFLLFLVPLYALGAGLFLTMLWHLLKRFAPVHIIACAVLLILLVVPLYISNRRIVSWPKEPAFVLAGMDQVRRKTPDNAVIWAWWDHGYALNYYAGRATVTDGSIHNGERVVYSALPLASDNFKMAANFMQFFVTQGEKGMRHLQDACGNDAGKALSLTKKVMAAGPAQAKTIIEGANLKGTENLQSVDDWLGFFFPEPKQPIYLFLDEKVPKIAYWWYWFGTYEVAKKEGRHPRATIIHNVTAENGWVTGSMGLRINIATGAIQLERMNLNSRLSGISNLQGTKPHEKIYNSDQGLFFGMIQRARYGILMERHFADSVFGNLFIRQRYNPKYFQPVVLNPPAYQLWEVRGDKWSGRE